MKRSANFLTVLMLSAVVILVANLSSAEAGGNCQAKLVDKSYDCNFTDNDFPPFSDCLVFATGGVSQYFDGLLGSTDYGCACDPKGSSFDKSSSTFECADSSSFFMLN